jgi:Spy/CpxP family protein refolding chaperone
MSEPTNPPPATFAADKPISLPVAVGVMGLILVVGAGLIWKYLYHPPAPANAIRTIAPMPGNPHVAGGPPAKDSGFPVEALKAIVAEADLPDGLHLTGSGTLIKAGDAYLRVRGTDSYAFGFFTLSEQEWEHGYLSQGVRRMLTQEDFAKELNLTADQRARLEKLPAAPAPKWPQADRDRLIALYKDEKTRPQVVAALATYAAERRAADQKVMAERIRQFRSILTEKQLARVNPLPRWPLTPASAPSTPDRVPRGP